MINKDNIGDLIIILGLLIIAITTFFVHVIAGFYVLAIILIVTGLLYIKGGE